MNKVLLVDNSSVIINVLKDFFYKKNNFKIYEAKSLSEVEELLKKHEFYACISKTVLEDALDGEHLKLLSENKIPTVVLTSKIDEEKDEVLSLPNIIDYVYKDSIYGLESVYTLIELVSFIDGIDVLVVDDSLVISEKIKALLESLLLKVHVAKNGKEALEILEKNEKISLVITDYHMDEMDGLELTRVIKKQEKYASLPIMIMTSFDSKELKVKLYKKGTTDFLLKPILEEELKAKVLNIFSNIKHLSEIESLNGIFDENVISSSTDKEGNIIRVSKAFCEISGYTKEELIGNKHSLVRHKDTSNHLFKDLWETIKSGKQWEGEIKNLRKDGEYYWVKVIIKPDFDRHGNIKGFTSVRQDITDKKKIYFLSITDSLTSLFNRRHFNELVEEIPRNKELKSLSFMLLDIDNFKKYNDTYGHQDGDTVLKGVSKALSDTFIDFQEDRVFRLGGEEFGILTYNKTKEEVEELALKAKQNIQNLNIEHVKNEAGVVTASFGVCLIDLNTKNLNFDEIYKKTDDALYNAKESGRNTIKVVNNT